MSEATNDDYKPRCQHLCCKSMMVYGEDFEMDPEYEEESTEFWCLMTSKSQGPDGEHVAMQQCCDSERECFKEF